MDLNFIQALAVFHQNQRRESSPKSFSVPVSAWVSSSDTNFPFVAEISASGIVASDSADIRFDKASIKAASEAGVLTGETSTEKIKLLSEKQPAAALSGIYIITKGAVE